MAIEIAPKIKIKMPLWASVFFGFCVIVVIALLASYLYFGKDIKEKTQQLTLTPEEQALKNEVEEKENRLLSYEDKINEFDRLLSEHKKTENVFALLEKISLPKVWFSSFNFIAKEGKVTVSGKADSFTILGQQILILKTEEFIKNVTLSGISIGEGGGANFSLLLTFNPQIFK